MGRQIVRRRGQSVGTVVARLNRFIIRHHTHLHINICLCMPPTCGATGGPRHLALTELDQPGGECRREESVVVIASEANCTHMPYSTFTVCHSSMKCHAPAQLFTIDLLFLPVGHLYLRRPALHQTRSRARGTYQHRQRLHLLRRPRVDRTRCLVLCYGRLLLERSTGPAGCGLHHP
jgi:hypothetical protein